MITKFDFFFFSFELELLTSSVVIIESFQLLTSQLFFDHYIVVCRMSGLLCVAWSYDISIIIIILYLMYVNYFTNDDSITIIRPVSLLSFFEFLRLNVIISWDVSINTFPLRERLVFHVLSKVTRSVSSLLFHILCLLIISLMLIQLPEFGQWVFSLSLYEYVRLNIIMCGIVSIITFWLVERLVFILLSEVLTSVLWLLFHILCMLIISPMIRTQKFYRLTLPIFVSSELIIYKYLLNNPYLFLLVCYFVQFFLFNVIHHLHCIILYFVIHLLFVLCQTLLLHFTSVYFPCKFLKINYNGWKYFI